MHLLTLKCFVEDELEVSEDSIEWQTIKQVWIMLQECKYPCLSLLEIIQSYSSLLLFSSDCFLTVRMPSSLANLKVLTKNLSSSLICVNLEMKKSLVCVTTCDIHRGLLKNWLVILTWLKNAVLKVERFWIQDLRFMKMYLNELHSYLSNTAFWWQNNSMGTNLLCTICNIEFQVAKKWPLFLRGVMWEWNYASGCKAYRLSWSIRIQISIGFLLKAFASRRYIPVFVLQSWSAPKDRSFHLIYI